LKEYILIDILKFTLKKALKLEKNKQLILHKREIIRDDHLNRFILVNILKFILKNKTRNIIKVREK